MSNVVARVQRMLEGAGFAKSTIALAAAKEGDFEVMEMLRAEFGSPVFEGGREGSAYMYAAAGNRADVMRWFAEKNVLPNLRDQERWQEDWSYANARRVHCRPAFVAAENGAIDALEYIAEQIPEITQYPVRACQMSAAIPGDFPRGASTGKIHVLTGDDGGQSKSVTYAGLLVVCALVTGHQGGDRERVVARLREQLADGIRPSWRDLELALRFDQFDTARLLLEAGARINLTEFLQWLKNFQSPIEAFACVSDFAEENGKNFEALCEPYEASGSRGEPPARHRNVDQMLAGKGGGFGHYVYTAVSAIRGMIKVDFGDRPKIEDAAALSAGVVRFMRSLDARFAGPAMLAAATSQYVPELVGLLLESGVNPNEYQPCSPDEPGVTYVGKRPERRLAVHDAGEDLMRLLVSYGADVNLPMAHTDHNLLYELCTLKDVDVKMLYVFAECGGDFARKFDGKTAASIAKKRGDEFYGQFMAAKAHIAVVGGVGEQKDNGPKKSSRSGVMSPL